MILLVTPNVKPKCYSPYYEFSSVHPGMEAEILKSYLVNIKGLKCRSIHMEADKIETDELIKIINLGEIKEVWVICAGTNPSNSTMVMPTAIMLAARLKAATNVKVVMYGGHPSALPELTQKQSGCDEVIVGNYIDCDASEIPMVDWDSIDPRRYRAHNWHCFGKNLVDRWNYACIWTTLGCPYSCGFCSVGNLHKGVPFSRRKRKIEDAVNEIEYLNKKFGTRNFRILDELFTYDLDRVDIFCNLLHKKDLKDLNMWCYSRVDTIDLTTLINLKSVGLNWIAYGLESLDQDTLDSVNKKTKIEDFDYAIKSARQAGVNIIADFIAGFPNDSYLSLERMYKYFEDNLFEMLNLYPLFNLPGTLNYDGNTDWSKYQLYGKDCCPAQTNHLTSKEVLEWRNMAFHRYMTSPRYLDMIENKFGDSTRQHVFRMMLRNNT